MRQTIKRMLAVLLAAGLLALCACSAQRTEAATQETARETADAPAAQDTANTPENASDAQNAQDTKPAEETSEEAPEKTPADQLPEPETEASAADEQAQEPEAGAAEGPLTCTISISCQTILDHMKELDPDKAELVPEDGWILAPVTAEFTEGQNVFDVLLAAVKANAIHMEYQNTPMYKSAYIEGIGNLYEFDCGELSGWMYRVNGWFPNYGCSRYAVQAGDVIEWVYTCDLGSDVGGSGVNQSDE